MGMEKAAAAAGSSAIPKEQGRAPVAAEEKAAPARLPSPPEQRWTRDQVGDFVRAALADFEIYHALTEEEIEEQYRSAGELHKYDPEKELDKRYAKIVKAWDPPRHVVPNKEYYLKLIEDED